jgi:hypothetical protein
MSTTKPPPSRRRPWPLQSLVAFDLGRGDKRRAADVFVRVSQLALTASAVVLAGLMLSSSSLPGIFTKDPAVIQQVTHVSRAVVSCWGGEPWAGAMLHEWGSPPATFARCPFSPTPLQHSTTC